MTDDRRRFARIGFDAPAWINSGVHHHPVTVLDLSFKGALVRATHPGDYREGLRGDLVIALGNGDDEICMAVELKHVEGQLLGLVCLHLDLDSMTHLRQVIALKLGDPALLERELKALVAS